MEINIQQRAAEVWGDKMKSCREIAMKNEDEVERVIDYLWLMRVGRFNVVKLAQYLEVSPVSVEIVVEDEGELLFRFSVFGMIDEQHFVGFTRRDNAYRVDGV